LKEPKQQKLVLGPDHIFRTGGGSEREPTPGAILTNAQGNVTVKFKRHDDLERFFTQCCLHPDRVAELVEYYASAADPA